MASTLAFVDSEHTGTLPLPSEIAKRTIPPESTDTARMSTEGTAVQSSQRPKTPSRIPAPKSKGSVLEEGGRKKKTPTAEKYGTSRGFVRKGFR